MATACVVCEADAESISSGLPLRKNGKAAGQRSCPGTVHDWGSSRRWHTARH